MGELSFYRAAKKSGLNVCLDLAFEVFIVYFKCSTKKGVGRIRNDAFTGREKLSTRPEGGLYKFLSELASAFFAQRLFLCKIFFSVFIQLNLEGFYVSFPLK
jgi:hypothetical protein